MQPKRDVSIFGRVRSHQFHIHLIHFPLVFSRPDQLLNFDRSMIQISTCQIVDTVISLSGIQQIVRDHGIEKRPLQLNIQLPKHDHVVFQVLANFFDRRVL